MTPKHTVEEIREKILNDLDLDFREYTPDQGMPSIVYEINEAQLDYIITQAHQAGIDEAVEVVEKLNNPYGLCYKSHPHGCEHCVYNEALDDTIKALQDK